MTSALHIIGAGGHGRVLADIAEAIGFTSIFFLDSAWPELKKSGPWPVVGTPEMLPAGAAFAVGIGNNQKRVHLLGVLPGVPVTLVHPSASVSPYAKIGAGSVICAGAVIGVGATLGQGCIVNTGASADHDCMLSDGVHLSPGTRLAGGVKIGAHTWIGIGAAVREYIKIGSEVMVGAGAAVICDVPDGNQVFGVPAKEC